MVKKEILRKAIHVILILFLTLAMHTINFYFGLRMVQYFLGLILTISIFFDWLIADLNLKLPIYTLLERKEERKGFHSTTYTIIAALIVVLFFNFKIAINSIIILAIGDAIAGVIRLKTKKAFMPTLTMFLISLIAGFFILKNISIAAIMAFTGALVERFVVKLNDNLIVPLAAAALGHLSLFLFS